MKKSHAIFVVVAFASAAIVASAAQESKATAPKAAAPPSAAHEAKAGQQYSGMYSFLREGEFLQITVEEESRVTGFVSRYGDGESDKGTFLDQYFRIGKIDGNKLTFTTETVHGVWFEFRGTVERGAGKNPGDEAYYVLKGTLTESATDAVKKVTTHPSEVKFKMFPAEASPARN
jgi:opacity protein-like surface antigen